VALIHLWCEQKCTYLPFGIDLKGRTCTFLPQALIKINQEEDASSGRLPPEVSILKIKHTYLEVI